MSTCNRLELQTLGPQPVVIPYNLPDHCSQLQIQLNDFEPAAGNPNGPDILKFVSKDTNAT